MSTRTVWCTAAAILLTAGLGRADAPSDTERQRGVSWVAGRKITALNIQPLVENRVNWIVQTPFGWQRGIDTPRIKLSTTGGVLWGETDQGLAVTTKLARDRGIHTLLKPHIWISGGGWRGQIRMADDTQWDEWFESYRRFILHYARFAQVHGIEALCIGTELRTCVIGHQDQWRRIISEVRAVYDGKLTYAANWYAEFEEITFWNELDFIGIQAYFPLSDAEDPTLEDLLQGWKKPLRQIQRVRKKFDKPVVFTEVGYRSIARAADKPWQWPRRGEENPTDTAIQARCYEAFFRTFWDKPWVAGVYWWKWFPNVVRTGVADNTGFTPQNKPAEKVMAGWYERPAPAPS